MSDSEPYFAGHEPDTSTFPTHVDQVVEGNPAGLWATAQRYTDTATALETLATEIRAAANRSSDVWDGDTAMIARAAVRATSARIHALVEPLRAAAAAHTRLANKLDIYQGRVQDYWDSASKNHLPQYSGAQWMSGAEEANIRNMPSTGDPDGTLQQDVEDVAWLKSEIWGIKRSAAGGRVEFFTSLATAQTACDVVDETWARVDGLITPAEPPATSGLPALPPVAPTPPGTSDGGGGGHGGTGGGGPAVPRGAPALPALPEVDVPELAPPANAEPPVTDGAPVTGAPVDGPLLGDGVPVVAPAAPVVASPVPDPAWAAEQVAVRDALATAPWTIEDDPDWSALVRADTGLQADLAARNEEVAAEAVRRFLETGATEGTFDVTVGTTDPAVAAPVTGSLTDRLGGLPPATPTGADAMPGTLHHHGATTVVRMDDGTYAVTVDAAYGWSDQIAPDATFADGSWQHGASGILTGGAVPYDFSVTWTDASVIAIDSRGTVVEAATPGTR